MHYYLYEIRNNINGKIYVGVHKTKVLDDGYMGSGKIIIRAINKHGVENFTKTILESFETQDEMFAREKEIVNEEFLLREDTYNLRRGGQGGWDYINSNGLNYGGQEGKSKSNQTLLRKYGRLNAYQLTNEDGRKGIDTLRKERKCAFFNKELRDLSNEKSQTQEARQKHKETLKNINHQQGEKNSQFGSLWITDGQENKKIKKTDLIPEGWYKGRKMNKSKEFMNAQKDLVMRGHH